MNQEVHHFIEFGPFRLDVTEGVLIRAGERVHLTPKAHKLLLVLVQNANHIVSKDELMKQVWPDTVVEETNLAGNIHALRQILNEGNDGERFIETIPKRGYRFLADVRQLSDLANPLAQNTDSPAVPLAKDFTESEISAASVTRGPAQQGKGGLVVKVFGAVVILCGLTAAAVYVWAWAKPKPEASSGPLSGPPITAIAVLPLKNFSGDIAQEYFADGMTEAVINELAKIGAVRVISRTSIMRYKHAAKTMPQIARELNVDAVLEGSVLRSGDRVRITAQLVKAKTDEHLWAESYERELRDVLAIQREIARGIASQIRVKLTPQEEQRLTNSKPLNPDAHDAYLKGLYYLNQAINTEQPRDSENLHKKGIEYFEQAIKFDSDYAPAYYGLAVSYHWLASSEFPQFYPKAKEFALKALEHDYSLAKAHAALGFIIWRHEWDFAGAEAEFKKAEEMAPGSDHWGYAQFLSTLGRHDEALRRFKIAEERDPLTLPLKISIGYAYLDARRYDQAIDQFRGILELDPQISSALSGLGTAYVLKDMHEEGIAACQQALNVSGQAGNKAILAWAYARAGRRNEALKMIEDSKKFMKPDSFLELAFARIYGALGERDLAFAQLEKAYAKGKLDGLLWLKVDPTLDSLRLDARFTDLIRRIGFPD